LFRPFKKWDKKEFPYLDKVNLSLGGRYPPRDIRRLAVKICATKGMLTNFAEAEMPFGILDFLEKHFWVSGKSFPKNSLRWRGERRRER
jgi:hypothetical protein